MTDTRPAAPAQGDRFEWHPTYAGRTADDVRRELAAEIARDQRAYELALEGAEHAEHASLSSVVDIDKRWSVYSFDWTDTDPDALAARIVAFELERERRRELIPYADYRTQHAGHEVPGSGLRSSMSDDQRRRVANVGAIVILAILAIIVVAIVLALL